MERIGSGIQDKHTGSATLPVPVSPVSYHTYQPGRYRTLLFLTILYFIPYLNNTQIGQVWSETLVRTEWYFSAACSNGGVFGQIGAPDKTEL
jgi:hypothetical protein